MEVASRRLRSLLRFDLALAACLTYVAFLGGTIQASSVLHLRAASQALGLGAILLWALAVWRGSRPWLRTPVDLGLALLLLAHAASTFTSADSRLSFERTLYLLFFLLLFYFFVDPMSRPGAAGRLARTLRLLSVAVIAFTFVEFAVWRWSIFGDLGWTETLRAMVFYRGRLVLGHANPLGWFLGMMVPFWLQVVRREGSLQLRANALIWLILLALAEVSTFSRGGWIVAASSGAVWAVLAAASSPMARSGVLKGWEANRGRLMIWVGAALALAVLGVALWTAATGIRQSSASYRFEIWTASLRLFAAQPVTGTGPGAFGLAIRSLPSPVPSYGSTASVHAHNGFLNVTVETGLLGMMAVVTIVLGFGRSVLQSLRTTGSRVSSENDPVGDHQSFLAALAGLMIGNLFDTIWHSPLMVFFLLLFAAVQLAPSTRFRPQAGTGRRWIPLAASLVLVGGFMWFDLAEAYQVLGLQAAEAGDRSSAREFLSQAGTIDPTLRVYPTQRAVVGGLEFLQSGDRAALDQSLAVFEEQVHSERLALPVHADLAWLRWYAGDRTGAASALREAIAIAPWESHLWMSMGFMSEISGNLHEAREAYSMALARQPELGQSAYWYTSAVSEEVENLFLRSMALATELPELPPDEIVGRQAHLAFYAGDVALARSLSSESPVSEETLQVRVLLALKDGDAVTAERIASQMLLHAEGGGLAYLLRGRSHLAQAQTPEAQRDFLAAARFGRPEGLSYLGEILFERGQYSEAVARYEAGLRPLCPEPGKSYVFDSDIYRRRGYSRDFTPAVLRCAPRDDLHTFYLHLAQAYQLVGRETDASELLAWLDQYHGTHPIAG